MGSLKRGSRKSRLAILIVALAVLAGVAILVWLSARGRPITLHGVVLKQDADPRKEAPIAGAAISAANADGSIVASGESDSSGGFQLVLSRGFKMGQPLALSFRHSDYQPLKLNETIADKIYIVRMEPTIASGSAQSNPNATRISNLLLRYTVKSTTDANIGSLVRTFEVVNPTCGQRSRNGRRALLARWKMEGRCRFLLSGRRPRERVPQRARLLHRRPLPFYPDRGEQVFRECGRNFKWPR